MALNSQQLEQFDDDGFLIVRRLIAKDELVELDQMVDRLLGGELIPTLDYKGWKPEHFYTFWEPGMKERSELPRSSRIRLMSNMYHHDPYFRALGSHPRIYEVTASLFRTGVQMFTDTVFMKPAHHGIEAALHQDTAFWPKLEPNVINFWMAIDPATVENGCLHVIPGAHKVDLPHHDHPVQGHILHDHEVDISRKVHIELEPGDANFFDSGLIHGSSPNRSDRSRKAYAAAYCSENVQHLEPWKLSTIAEDTPDYTFELIEPPVTRNSSRAKLL